ncbi:DNA polymerase theta-like [Tachypleus tridentatus]|uniref:DNA polymerase theta-like n=1 Tax=Tachypleus tridentatus TaxID=6853 RepID=UPI003FD6A1FE
MVKSINKELSYPSGKENTDSAVLTVKKHVVSTKDGVCNAGDKRFGVSSLGIQKEQQTLEDQSEEKNNLNETNRMEEKNEGVQLSVFSTDKCQMSSWGLPDSIMKAYQQKGIDTMFPWQVECLLQGEVLHGGNLVYSAPTSAGKTLVAEILMLKKVLESKKKAIMILPFVSVAREKMFYFQSMFQEEGVRVDGYMGNHDPPGGFKSIDIAVCTIEKANSLVNRLIEEGKLDQLGILVVDELHLLGDSHRGYLLELLLTKVLFVSKSFDNTGTFNPVQVVGMSATLPNLELLAFWLRADLYYTDFRPVPLQEHLKIGDAMYEVQTMEQVATMKDRELTIHGDSDHTILLSLDTVVAGHSVLIFCPTKNWCEKLAESIAREVCELGRPYPPGVKAKSKSKECQRIGSKLREVLNGNVLSDILEQLKRSPSGLDNVLGKTIPFGVAYHHAGLTFDERDIIEGAFRQGAVKFLVATSTLSSGVNLPAHRVIIRSPMFYGSIIDVLTYKQMIGRAGRKGVDIKGESILLCKENERERAISLVKSDLKPVQSCLLMKEEHSLTGCLKRAILEVVASGVTTTLEEVARYASCTLLAASLQKEKKEQAGTENAITACIDYLMENEFIICQTNSEQDHNKTSYIPSQLGKAVLSSALSPDEGLNVLKELEKARRCFVLENELHLIYQVTPPYLAEQMDNIDWFHFLSMWENLSEDMHRVGELVGVEERFLARAVRGQIKSSVARQAKSLLTHKRFYAALALNELVQEVPLSQVSRKYDCPKGVLQSLQQGAATFAGMVTVFCNRLGWHNLELLISQFHNRLHFGIQRELCDLVRLTSLNAQRARALYNGGYETIAALAVADPHKIEQLLRTSTPFQSAKQGDDEMEHQAQQRKEVRAVWITGKKGLTEKEAAELIIKEAHFVLQKDLGIEIVDKKLPKQSDKISQHINVNKSSEESDSNVNLNPTSMPFQAAEIIKHTSQSAKSAEKYSLDTSIYTLSISAKCTESVLVGQQTGVSELTEVNPSCLPDAHFKLIDHNSTNNLTASSKHSQSNTTNMPYEPSKQTTNIITEPSKQTQQNFTCTITESSKQTQQNLSIILTEPSQQKPSDILTETSKQTQQKPTNILTEPSKQIQQNHINTVAELSKQTQQNPTIILNEPFKQSLQKTPNILTEFSKQIQQISTNILTGPSKQTKQNPTNILTKPSKQIQQNLTNILSESSKQTQENFTNITDVLSEHTCYNSSHMLNESVKLSRTTPNYVSNKHVKNVKPNPSNILTLPSKHTKSDPKHVSFEHFQRSTSSHSYLLAEPIEQTTHSKNVLAVSSEYCLGSTSTGYIHNITNSDSTLAGSVEQIQNSNDDSMCIDLSGSTSEQSVARDISVNEKKVQSGILSVDNNKEVNRASLVSSGAVKCMQENSKDSMVKLKSRVLYISPKDACAIGSNNVKLGEEKENMLLKQDTETGHRLLNTSSYKTKVSQRKKKSSFKNTRRRSSRKCTSYEYEKKSDVNLKQIEDSLGIDHVSIIESFEDSREGVGECGPTPGECIQLSIDGFTKLLDCIDNKVGNCAPEKWNNKTQIHQPVKFSPQKKAKQLVNSYMFNESCILDTQTAALLDGKICHNSSAIQVDNNRSREKKSQDPAAAESEALNPRIKTFDHSESFSQGDNVCLIPESEELFENSFFIEPQKFHDENFVINEERLSTEINMVTEHLKLKNTSECDEEADKKGNNFATTDNKCNANIHQDVKDNTIISVQRRNCSKEHSAATGLSDRSTSAIQPTSITYLQHKKISEPHCTSKKSDHFTTEFLPQETSIHLYPVDYDYSQEASSRIHFVTGTGVHHLLTMPVTNENTVTGFSETKSSPQCRDTMIQLHKTTLNVKKVSTIDSKSVKFEEVKKSQSDMNMHILPPSSLELNSSIQDLFDVAINMSSNVSPFNSPYTEEKVGEISPITNVSYNPNKMEQESYNSKFVVSPGLVAAIEKFSGWESCFSLSSTPGKTKEENESYSLEQKVNKSQRTKTIEIPDNCLINNCSQQNTSGVKTGEKRKQEKADSSGCCESLSSDCISPTPPKVSSFARQQTAQLTPSTMCASPKVAYICNRRSGMATPIKVNSHQLHKPKTLPDFDVLHSERTVHLPPVKLATQCPDDPFTIIDVAAHQRLFYTFIKEWSTKTTFSFSVACQKETDAQPHGIGSDVNEVLANRLSANTNSSELKIDGSDSCVVGVAVCWEKKDVYYISLVSKIDASDLLCEESLKPPPVDTNLTVEERLQAIQSVLEKFSKTSHSKHVSAFDLKQQFHALYYGCDVSILTKKHIYWEDPKVAEWLLDPGARQKTLLNMAINRVPNEAKLLEVVGRTFGVGSVGLTSSNGGSPRLRSCAEAAIVLHLMEKLREELKQKELLRAFQEVEMPSLLSLAKMEQNGIGFSAEECQCHQTVLQKQLQSLEEYAHRLAHHQFSLTSSQEVARVLFKELKLPPGGDPGNKVNTNCLSLRTSVRGRRTILPRELSTSKEALEKLRDFHPLPAVILNWRKVSSALKKVVFPLLKEKSFHPCLGMHRIYGICETYTATGRVTMHEPNLQNIPKEFELISETSLMTINSTTLATCTINLRSSFVPRTGAVFLAADYSQLELRVLAHLSGDKKLCALLKSGGDVFQAVAAQWKKRDMLEVTEKERQQAKQICYGIIYGIGAKALSDQLGVNEDEAIAFSEGFKNTFPAIKKYLQLVVDQCRQKEYVNTLYGRRRYLLSINSQNHHARAQAERQAVNTIVQGSAADLMKISMARIDQELAQIFSTTVLPFKKKKTEQEVGACPGSFLVLQLHDELIYEVSKKDLEVVAKIVKREMEQCVKLSVPLSVKLKVGPNWGTLSNFE